MVKQKDSDRGTKKKGEGSEPVEGLDFVAPLGSESADGGLETIAERADASPEVAEPPASESPQPAATKKKAEKSGAASKASATPKPKAKAPKAK